MGRGGPAALAWAALAVALLGALHVTFVQADLGRWFDDAALAGRVVVPPDWLRDAAPPVTAACVGLLSAAAAVVVVAALAGGRRAEAALAVGYVAAVVVSAQALKALLPGGGGPDPASLPSGHASTAIALAAVVVALAPARWRPPAAVAVALAASLVGLGVVASHAHRPSDVPAAGLVCLAWAAVVAALAGRLGVRRSGARAPRAAAAAAVLLALPTLAALVAFAGASLAGADLPTGTSDDGFYAVGWTVAATAPAAAVAAIACLWAGPGAAS